MSFNVRSELPELWEAYYFMLNGIEYRTSVCRYQWYALRDQLHRSIMAAETCRSRRTGESYIQELRNIILNTNQFIYEARHENWATAIHRNFKYNQFISDQARMLDRVLSGLTEILNTNLGSTVALIEQAKLRDDAWINQFVSRVDQATPAPGSFERAYRDGNSNQLDVLATQVLNKQSELLSTPSDLQPSDVQNARDLTNWLINITKKRPQPSILLGQRFMGAFKPYRSTAKYELFQSQFVTGETVIIKALRRNIPGRNIDTQIQRFQAATEVVHRLRCDFTLPFYGIGKSDFNGQTLVYSVAPYISNGDAVTYHETNVVSIARSLQIAYDVARGLAYLHEADPPIVHSGVRTDNVLINSSGRGILAGFGSIQDADSDLDPSYTGSSDMHRYLAPEYIEPPIRRKTSGDVWAWAMVALEIVGNKSPFYGMTDFRVATQITNGERPERKQYPRILELTDADKFWSLLESCWAHEEWNRPNMSEIVPRMKNLCNANPVSKPLREYDDQPTIDEPLYDGRRNSPVAQGPRPRYGGGR